MACAGAAPVLSPTALAVASLALTDSSFCFLWVSLTTGLASVRGAKSVSLALDSGREADVFDDVGAE